MGKWETGRKGDEGQSNGGQGGGGGGGRREKIEKCPLAFIHSGVFPSFRLVGIITKQINQYKDIVPTKYVILPTRYYTDWEESQCFRRKVPKFLLARSARSQSFMGFSRVSGFLVRINHHDKTISWVLRTFIVPRNHVIYQQNIEENRMFQTQKYQTFLLARNQYSFSFLDFLVFWSV